MNDLKLNNVKNLINLVNDMLDKDFSHKTQNTEYLLKQICSQSFFSELEKKRIAHAEYFNFFDAFEPIDDDERKHSKILKRILSAKQKAIDSSGNEYYDRYVLKSFWNYFKNEFNLDIFDEYIDDDAFNRATFNLEKSIFVNNRYRFIDLVISFDNFIIPFEIKIEAEDQDNQCEDYIEYSSIRNKHAPILFYLTKNGKEPAENSIKSDSRYYKCIRLISWKNHVIEWLDYLIKDDNLDCKIKFFLQEYILILKNICEVNDMTYRDDLFDLILKDKNNLLATAEIVKNYNDLKTLCLENIMKELSNNIRLFIKENGLENEWLISEQSINWKSVRNFYSEKTWPSIAIGLTNASYKSFGFELAFEIADNGRAYTGVCELSQEKIPAKNLAHELSFVKRPSNTWCDYTYIDESNDNFKGINFKNFKGYEELMLNTEEGKKIRKEFCNTVVDQLVYYYDLLKQEPKIWKK